MRHKIRVLVDEVVGQEIVLESLKVLAAIEKKYNYKFEFQNELGSSELRLKMPRIRKKNLNRSEPVCLVLVEKWMFNLPISFHQFPY